MDEPVKKRMPSGKIIAIVGKGGTGKTAVSAVLSKLMIRTGLGRILLIDADPAMGLAITLAAGGDRTVGAIRESIIEQARKKDQAGKAQMAGIVDYLLMEALEEREGYSILSMGRMESKGCFCPVNALLREAIDDLAVNFDYIVIDGEAGLEQINREVVRRVDVLIIVTDASKRGLHTARLIREVVGGIKDMQPERMGVIFNRVDELPEKIEREVEEMGLEFFGSVRTDPTILEYDAQGVSLHELPDESEAVKALRPIMRKIINHPIE